MVAAYYTEAEWSNKNYMPSFNEYNEKAGYITGGRTAYIAAMLLAIGDETVGKTEIEWLKTRPKILKPAHVIARAKNDIVGHKVCKFFPICRSNFHTFIELTWSILHVG